MSVLVTGAAGFIGYHVTASLLSRGEQVVGIDDLNPYYDVALKEARLAQLQGHPGFSFERLDLSDREGMGRLFTAHPEISRIVHLAAQAGVRYSLANPFVYAQANVCGFLVLLEEARRLRKLDHIVFASSSSVYGTNTKVPFAVEDRTDTPVSLYAATKKASELMAHVYSHLYRLPMTGLRFFTVYGPWGRPDMAAYIFTRKIIADEAIAVFNHGDMRRDFTYIDDVVQGVVSCLDNPPFDDTLAPPLRVYNLGNSRSENLMDFIAAIEDAVGKKAHLDLKPMQPGDVKETYADIAASTRDFGFVPRTTIREGIPRFVEWYRQYHGVA